MDGRYFVKHLPSDPSVCEAFWVSDCIGGSNPNGWGNTRLESDSRRPLKMFLSTRFYVSRHIFRVFGALGWMRTVCWGRTPTKAREAELDAISYYTGIDKSKLHERGEDAYFDYGGFGFRVNKNSDTEEVTSINETK